MPDGQPRSNIEPDVKKHSAATGAGLSIRQLLPPMLKGHWHQVAILFVVVLFTAVMEGIGFSLVVPLLQNLLSATGDSSGGNTVQRVFSGISLWFPPPWRLAGLLGLLAFVFLIKSLGLITSSGLTRWFVDTLRMDWVARIFTAYAKAPYSVVAARPHGEVVQTIIGETDLASRGVLLLVEFAARCIQITVLLSLLLLTNWQTMLFIAALGALVFGLTWGSTHRFALEAGRSRQLIRRDVSDVVNETITGLRTIKLLDLATSRAKWLRKVLREYRLVDTRFEVASSLPSSMKDLIGVTVGSAIILFMTMGLGLRIDAVLPTLALFMLVFLRLADAAGYVFSKRLQIASSLPQLRAVYDAMITAPEQMPGAVSFPGFSGEIAFEDVVLQPPGRPVIFDGLNLRIAPRGLTAIVGPSGAGKTTLVDLIVRLREPDRGRVLIGGHDVREFDVRSLRARVGYLSQDPQLFNGTVAENLLLGRPGASEAEMLDAARRAYVHEFVSAMAQGYATPLGRAGLMLSGGQRQRLALARELLRSPDLYIFDEPTSALDHETETVIGELINELSNTHPVVIISHRPDVIYGAKRIYRIEHGKAAEMNLPELRKVGAAP
jgi:ABC-type multidrug transport system fused ATPase/permease subunit